MQFTDPANIDIIKRQLIARVQSKYHNYININIKRLMINWYRDNGHIATLGLYAGNLPQLNKDFILEHVKLYNAPNTSNGYLEDGYLSRIDCMNDWERLDIDRDNFNDTRTYYEKFWPHEGSVHSSFPRHRLRPENPLSHVPVESLESEVYRTNNRENYRRFGGRTEIKNANYIMSDFTDRQYI